jgi:hypothetical protein
MSGSYNLSAHVKVTKNDGGPSYQIIENIFSHNLSK